MRRWLCTVFFLAVATALPASAATLRWASDTDVRSLDPYAGREILLRSFDANIYEPLVRRGRDLALEPALAIRWSEMAPDRWRFILRPDVVFQDGTPFTAADVVFSFARAQSVGSKLSGVLAPVRQIIRIDDHTIDIVTGAPDPILPAELTEWGIMSEAWCAAHDAAAPADPAAGDDSYANDHANGTGPFMVAQRGSESETVLVPNPRWWDKRQDNLDKVIFRPIPDGETRVEDLITGKVDLIYPVPPQAIELIRGTPGLHLVQGPGTETIFLGFDQHSTALAGSDVKTRNPFKDRRVREAVYRAIDEGAISSAIMRGFATPSALMVAPSITGFAPDLDRRPSYDPAAARRLLAQAGYPEGFSTGMDCPTDRYVNDGAICRAVVAMLAKIGIRVALDAQSRAEFFTTLYATDHATSFFLLGWTPRTYDAQDMLVNLAATPDPAEHLGDYNFGGYSNPALDALIPRIAGEADRDKRRVLLRRALKLIADDFAFVPLHQQDVVWAARNGVELVQRADDALPLRYVRVK